MNIDWQRRAIESIHHGSLTNSKRPTCFVKEHYPSHVSKGDGCYLYDSDGKKYIDFICALGTNLVGYSNPDINDHVIKQIYKGTLYSFGSTLEVQAAEKLKELFPFVGKLRFLKTGSEAASASLRIAMAHTGRFNVLSHGYHGWDDCFVSLTPPAEGVPIQPHISKFNEDLNQIDETVAAVIIEPIITELSKERILFLQELQAKCKKTGTLLIFDEIITGFRFPKYSFSNYSGIQPDILLLGKAIGGGFPLSVVMTKKGIGEDKEWFISSTFAGDTIAIAGMMKIIDLLNSKYNLDLLWSQGEAFINSFNEIEPDIVKINGYSTRGAFVGSDMNKAVFFQEACKAGILFGSSFWFNFTHQKVSEIVLNSCRDILSRIKNKQAHLEGTLPSTPFAQKVREQKNDKN